MENKYPDYIVWNVRQALGLEYNDESKDAEINSMRKMEVMKAYWQWEGIIGYEHEMVRVMEAIFGVDLYDLDN